MKDETTTTRATQTYYLWHLAALGVIDMDSDTAEITDTLWDQLAAYKNNRPATVVMIDVGCHFAHPNLKGRVDQEASIDFTSTPAGQKLAPAETSESDASHFAELNVDDLRLDGLESTEQSLFSDIVQHLKSLPGETRPIGDVESLFASHGTAVAGLVVGGPEMLGDDKETTTKGIIPYFGVDPFSRLISVRTGFDDDPLQFIAALLYAWAQSPDVIVMPRGLPDPTRNALSYKDDFKAELESWASREAADLIDRIAEQEEKAGVISPHAPVRTTTQARLWDLVRALFVAISQKTPIVCAAGNEGESQLLYPAALASRENGIIAVGAVTSAGYRSGYANYGDGLTLVAPSDDMAVFNRTQLRATTRDAAQSAPLKPKDAQQIPLSESSLLSTDIPGPFGYESGDGIARDTPQDGYYTQFGGTSGAAALVAGVIALVRRAEQVTEADSALDGPDMRALLTRTARHDIRSPDGSRPLQADSMNAVTEEADDRQVFFGAGLVDAAAALSEILGGKA